MSAPEDLVVNDVSVDSLDANDFDLIIVAKGKEARSLSLYRRLSSTAGVSLASRTLLLNLGRGESTLVGDEQASEVIDFGSLSSLDAQDILRTRLEQSKSSKILLDYSCMYRTLYLPTLKALRRHARQITFCYSIGRYGSAELDYPISLVGDIRAVPTLEGLSYPSRPRLYLFGLGYDGTGTRALAEKLEAERVVVLWAEPGATVRSADIALRANASLIADAALSIKMDLRRVSETVQTLRRVAFETRHSDKLVMVPVGPKPHVLACGIVAAQFDHVTVLSPYHGKGGVQSPVDVEASGEYVCTRVEPTH